MEQNKSTNSTKEKALKNKRFINIVLIIILFITTIYGVILFRSGINRNYIVAENKSIIKEMPKTVIAKACDRKLAMEIDLLKNFDPEYEIEKNEDETKILEEKEDKVIINQEEMKEENIRVSSNSGKEDIKHVSTRKLDRSSGQATENKPVIIKIETKKELINIETKNGIETKTYKNTIYNVYNDGSKQVKDISTNIEQKEVTYDENTKDLILDAKEIKSRNYNSIESVLKYVNEYREEANMKNIDGISNRKKLTLDTDLTIAACIRAKEMSKQGKISHTRPNGSKCFTILDDMNINYTKTAENIASGQATAEIVSSSWKNSEGHYKNIINPEFTQIGVGVINSEGRNYWVQLFI